MRGLFRGILPPTSWWVSLRWVVFRRGAPSPPFVSPGAGLSGFGLPPGGSGGPATAPSAQVALDLSGDELLTDQGISQLDAARNSVSADVSEVSHKGSGFSAVLGSVGEGRSGPYEDGITSGVPVFRFGGQVAGRMGLQEGRKRRSKLEEQALQEVPLICRLS